MAQGESPRNSVPLDLAPQRTRHWSLWAARSPHLVKTQGRWHAGRIEGFGDRPPQSHLRAPGGAGGGG